MLLLLRLFFRNPLFSPCKCSGSIGSVHQECLVSWLEVTRGDGTCVALCLRYDNDLETSGTISSTTTKSVFCACFMRFHIVSHVLVWYLSFFCRSPLQADVNCVTPNFALILNMPKILPIDCRPTRSFLAFPVDSWRSGCPWPCE